MLEQAYFKGISFGVPFSYYKIIIVIIIRWLLDKKGAFMTSTDTQINKLELMRKRKKFTYKKIATRLDVPVGLVSTWFHFRSKIPYKYVKRIAELFKVQPKTIINKLPYKERYADELVKVEVTPTTEDVEKLIENAVIPTEIKNLVACGATSVSPVKPSSEQTKLNVLQLIYRKVDFDTYQAVAEQFN